MTRYKLLLWFFCIGFFLSSCSTFAPQVVNVPVAVKCAADVGPEPAYPDSKEALRAAANIQVRVQLMIAGSIVRTARIDELTAALTACS